MTTGRCDGRWEGWSRWVSWRVTRYDPARRDWRGAYPSDEWTGCYDMGRAFRDGVLTPGRYLACEDAYVAVVEEAVRESGVAGLRVASLTPLCEKILEGKYEYILATHINSHKKTPNLIILISTYLI